MSGNLAITVLWNGIISVERDYTRVHYLTLEDFDVPDECHTLHVIIKGSYDEIIIPIKCEYLHVTGTMNDVYKWLRMTLREKVDVFTPTKPELVDFACIGDLSCNADCKALNIRRGDTVDIYEVDDLQYVEDDGAQYLVIAKELGGYTIPFDVCLKYYVWDIGEPGSILDVFRNSTKVEVVSIRPIVGSKDFPHKTPITNLTITAPRIKELRKIIRRCPNLTTLTIKGTKQKFYKVLRNNKKLTSINLPYDDSRIHEIIRRNLISAYEKRRAKNI